MPFVLKLLVLIFYRLVAVLQRCDLRVKLTNQPVYIVEMHFPRLKVAFAIEHHYVKFLVLD